VIRCRAAISGMCQHIDLHSLIYWMKTTCPYREQHLACEPFGMQIAPPNLDPHRPSDRGEVDRGQVRGGVGAPAVHPFWHQFEARQCCGVDPQYLREQSQVGIWRYTKRCESNRRERMQDLPILRATSTIWTIGITGSSPKIRSTSTICSRCVCRRRGCYWISTSASALATVRSKTVSRS